MKVACWEVKPGGSPLPLPGSGLWPPCLFLLPSLSLEDILAGGDRVGLEVVLRTTVDMFAGTEGLLARNAKTKFLVSSLLLDLSFDDGSSGGESPEGGIFLSERTSQSGARYSAPRQTIDCE